MPGDYDSLTTIFDYLQMVPLLSRRTAALFNHSGLFTTETKTLWGLYDPCDYGDNATVRATAAALGATGVLPPAYQNNTYLRYDFGGDAGLTELSFMVLDWYEHTMDDDGMRRYLPLLVGTLDFFCTALRRGGRHRHPAPLPDAGARDLSVPVQLAAVAGDVPRQRPPDRRGAPRVDRACARAAGAPHHRRAARPVAAAPLVAAGGAIGAGGRHDGRLPYETYPLPGVPRSNVETPELYSTHPFRYFSVGSARAKGRDLNASLACLENSTRPTCRFADSNSGWTQACSTRRSRPRRARGGGGRRARGDAAGGGVPFPRVHGAHARLPAVERPPRRHVDGAAARAPRALRRRRRRRPPLPGVAVRMGRRLQAARAAADDGARPLRRRRPRPTRRAAARATRRDRGAAVPARNANKISTVG